MSCKRNMGPNRDGEKVGSGDEVPIRISRDVRPAVDTVIGCLIKDHAWPHLSFDLRISKWFTPGVFIKRSGVTAVLTTT